MSSYPAAPVVPALPERFASQGNDVLQGSFLGVAPRVPQAERVRILLVSPDARVRQALEVRLTHPRWILCEAYSGADALEKLASEESEIMLVDPHLPDLDFGEFQDLVRLEFPGVQCVPLHTPAGSMQVSSLLGHDLEGLLRPSTPPLVPGPAFLPEAAKAAAGWQGMIGSAPAMQRVFHAAQLVARRDTTVLIGGESGTGKDLLARGIHTASAREKQPFVVINCAAIPESLLEAELFGYTKGAFTGAAQARIGRVHAAHGGTLFLDEIGDMPFPLQSKILRFLEQGEVQRIGGTDTLKVDCRVIAATNVNLKQQVKEKQFREDLYYRLAVFPIELPPLRARKDDLEALIQSFLTGFCPGLPLRSAARQKLLEHEWPGNIRELRNVLERASLFGEARGEIWAEDIVF